MPIINHSTKQYTIEYDNATVTTYDKITSILGVKCWHTNIEVALPKGENHLIGFIQNGITDNNKHLTSNGHAHVPDHVLTHGKLGFPKVKM